MPRFDCVRFFLVCVVTYCESSGLTHRSATREKHFSPNHTSNHRRHKKIQQERCSEGRSGGFSWWELVAESFHLHTGWPERKHDQRCVLWDDPTFSMTEFCRAQSTSFRKRSRPDQATNHQNTPTYGVMGFPARFVILSGQMIENEGSQHKFYFEFMMSYRILFVNSGESEAKLALSEAYNWCLTAGQQEDKVQTCCWASVVLRSAQ